MDLELKNSEQKKTKKPTNSSTPPTYKQRYFFQSLENLKDHLCLLSLDMGNDHKGARNVNLTLITKLTAN